MSSNTPLDRDESGRFKKPAEDVAQPDDGDMHPAAKTLFGWVSRPATPTYFLWGTIGLALLLLVIDYGLHRHEYMDFANFNGFYGFWGFAAFALAVLSGWPLGRLLRRDEDYYGEGDPTPDVSLDGDAD